MQNVAAGDLNLAYKFAVSFRQFCGADLQPRADARADVELSLTDSTGRVV